MTGFGGLGLKAVALRYPGGTEALREFSLTLAPGDRLMLVGPSGAGKSTVLRLMAGLMPPTAGKVSWTGARPRTGMVFQDPTLLPWRTALGNVALPLRLSGMARAEARGLAADRLETLGLKEFMKSVPAELSGGMRMRVALARALVASPELLLLDEPFAALDEITRHRLEEDVLALCVAEGLTMVFVTHSIFESAFVGSRVAILTPRPGRVAEMLEFGTTAPGPGFRSSEPFRLRVGVIERALTGAAGEYR